MNLIKKLRGTGVALITPFTSSGKIDFPALEKIINYIIKNKCEYIVVLGTTAESATLSADEKQQLTKHVADFVNGRVTLVLGIGGNNTAEIIQQFKKGNLKGYDAILSVSPYYSRPTQEGIYQHYKIIADESPIPVLLYNVPSRTGSNLSADTTLRLSRIRGIIGIKEASGNMEQCMHLLKERPKDFLIISGDDSITLPLIACGADGVISVAANAFPKIFSSMVRYALGNDFIKARPLHYTVFPIIPMLFQEGNPAGIKAALAALKFCGQNLRLPLVPVSKKLSAEITRLTNEIVK
jgi:4-hydroxy-tetrahydrodipicolinate synthase